MKTQRNRMHRTGTVLVILEAQNTAPVLRPPLLRVIVIFARFLKLNPYKLAQLLYFCEVYTVENHCSTTLVIISRNVAVF